MSSEQGRYIQLFSIHGRLRSENMELGSDADTGGQIKYVVELAKALADQEGVEQVDLFTRLIDDKTVSSDYGRPVETVSDRCRIVRIQCGGRKYMRKELLWPYLDEYVDKTIKFIKQEKRIPDIVHGHYPDAGYVAAALAAIFGTPLIYTGHSLGRSKLDRLLRDGMTEQTIDKKYKIHHRIQMEEAVLEKADLVVASTTQETRVQYGQYENKDMPSYKVIPPGLDIEKFYPYYHDVLPESDKDERQLYARASLIKELERFFMQPQKPLILSLCRPDKRKNIAGLVQAFGEDPELQAMANLAVFAGIRKDIAKAEDNERDVLTRMLLLMDKYDLYGKMAIPKKHDFEYEVPELYRIAAAKRGVFVNPALTEPFGITLIESAACGLPIVAPDDGGPADIIDNCRCGCMVDTTRPDAIAAAAKRIIAQDAVWDAYSQAGVTNIRKYYTWDHHAAVYVQALEKLLATHDSTTMRVASPSDAIGRRLVGLNAFLVADLDGTLIGDANERLEDFVAFLSDHSDQIGFGVATGRSMASARDHLQQHGLPLPDVLIAAAGSEIYYGEQLNFGKGWETHISAGWDRDKIVELLEDLPFLTKRSEAAQGRFKISYTMAPAKDRIATVHDRLLHGKCRFNLIASKDKYLDILPHRASKGKAVRYLSYQWEIPLGNFLICGDSGTDEDMLRGEPKAVVVGNHDPELEGLKGLRRIYFAQHPLAAGILEGIDHFGFTTEGSED